MIEVKNLVKRYGEVLALDHFNLNVADGEIFGLLGPNGSGKTTAINCMLSLLKYDRGEIRLFGERMSPDNYKSKQKIGVVMQNVAVYNELTVEENIDYFCGLYVRQKKQAKRTGKRGGGICRTCRLSKISSGEALRRSASEAEHCLWDCP